MERPTLKELRTAVIVFDEAALARLERDPRRGACRIAQSERRRRERQARETKRVESLLELERPLWARGLSHIAGVDEAGAGPLAGPVVAAAVILPPHLTIRGMDDSKKLAPKKREQLAHEIHQAAAAWAIGMCSVDEIDTLNIFQASRKAMSRAVRGLSVTPDTLLVDARNVPDVSMPQRGILHGDSRSHSIAAASILAKTYRDALMREADRAFPVYGFAAHKGYGTRAHMRALEQHGPCPLHRRSFGPVAACLGTTSDHISPPSDA